MFKVRNPFHFHAFDRDSLVRALRRFEFESVFVTQDIVARVHAERLAELTPGGKLRVVRERESSGDAEGNDLAM